MSPNGDNLFQANIATAFVREDDLQTCRPIHSERHVKVVCIGAGASGLLFAYKLQRDFSNFSLTIYEKNADVGGTWFENKYPGCACDVPSHNYTFSFEPKADWSSTYASSKEIHGYFDAFSRKYDIRRYCRFRHEVVRAVWSPSLNGYELGVREIDSMNEFSDHCDILINAGGVVNAWKWPEIPGLKEFKGQVAHTANWDESINLHGKVVGLIGNGSSGVQILPAIQPQARKLISFIREPTWITPLSGLDQKDYTQEEKEAFAHIPGHLTNYRKGIESGSNSQFAVFLRDSRSQQETRSYMTKHMSEKLQNSGLETRLIPRWSVGCRRLTPGPGYLEALGATNVELIQGPVQRITEHGCVGGDGKERHVDILICATGFDTSFRPRFPVIGLGGKNLQDDWNTEARSYMGVAAAGFPNYLILLGPSSPVGNGPLLSAVEIQTDYILKLIDRYQTQNIQHFSPLVEAVNDFVEFKDQFMKGTIWADSCRSWYKTNDVVTALWPGSTLHYMEALDEVRWDDWRIQYQGNRFKWLGNGYSQTEVDETADWAYYIRDCDDGPYLSRRKKLRILNRSGTVEKQDSSFLPIPQL
ncbi:hypothetical protein BBP40_005188 [Aspergillus hancockii]|nr:hypothetical protein BBP40_005188 [Aspergillus hancockii]